MCLITKVLLDAGQLLGIFPLATRVDLLHSCKKRQKRVSW